MKKLFLIALTFLAACGPASRPETAMPAISTTTSSTASTTPIPRTLHTETPAPIPTIPASLIELDGAEIQPGFSLIKFADLPRPTAFAFDATGRMYAASQDGKVYLLTDENRDGRADTRSVFASGYVFPLGIAIHAPTGDVYLSHQGVISIPRDKDGDDRADEEEILAGDLPFGQHQNDNLEFGPDGRLYVGVGSTCDACDDTNPLSASILRFDIETGEREVFATGLRNPFDIAFHPATGDLFATDNGRDDLGMEAPFEELNHIVPGGDYGYPQCWNSQDQPGCENSIPAIASFEAHSSADGVVVYGGKNFPEEYRGNVFVTIFGSWLKAGVQTGIQRVVLIPEGDTFRTEVGWLVRFPQGVMPLPLSMGPDGGLYVGDYINDTIYRISYGLP